MSSSQVLRPISSACRGARNVAGAVRSGQTQALRCALVNSPSLNHPGNRALGRHSPTQSLRLRRPPLSGGGNSVPAQPRYCRSSGAHLCPRTFAFRISSCPPALPKAMAGTNRSFSHPGSDCAQHAEARMSGLKEGAYVMQVVCDDLSRVWTAGDLRWVKAGIRNVPI